VVFRSPGAIAVHIGPLSIRWYGVLIALAVLVGTTLAQRQARRKGLDPDPLTNAIVLAIICALVGARLYYVAFNWDYYAANLAKIVAVWEGGLAIHGGLLAGLLGGGAYALLRRLPLAHYLDICAPSLILAQAIGRWGNFFNQEAFGTPTDVPWRLYIDPAHRPPALAPFEFFHPTFLYEFLWNLAVFALLVGLLRRPLERFPGALFLAYLGLYSAGRFFIEALRTDSLMLGPLRAAQVVSVLLVATSAGGILYLLRGGRPAPRSP